MKDAWNIEEIVLQVQNGDEAAFEKLMHRYEKLVYYIALQRVGNDTDAMDIAQETWIEIKKSISQLKEPRYFKAWLNKVIISKISRHYERSKDRSMNPGDEVYLYRQKEGRYYMDPQRCFQYQNNRDTMNLCLDELKDIYREVLVMQYFEGMSMREIAQTLDIPEGTVKTRLRTAKKELRTVIEQMRKDDRIALDFNSTGWQWLLAIAYGNHHIGKAAMFFHMRKHSSWRYVTHPNWVMGIAAVAGISVLGVAAIATPMINNTQEQEMVNVNRSMLFPNVSYHDVVITDARSAYSMLYYAYVNKSDWDEQCENLYRVLLDYGGEYAKMAQYIKQEGKFGDR